MAGDKGRWVRLPEGAQVTMSKGEFENTQRLGTLSKIGIGAIIAVVLWVLGMGDDNPSPGPGSDNVRPSSTSAPESVDHG